MLGGLIAAAEAVDHLVNNDPGTTSSLVASAESIASYTVSASLLVFSLRRGSGTSGVQFVFFLLETLVRAVYLGSAVISGRISSPNVSSVLLSLRLGLASLLLLLNCWSDGRQKPKDERAKSKNRSPHEGASFPNRLSFGWFSRLIYKGYRRPLTLSDLWELSHEFSSEGLVPRFDKHFHNKSSEK